MISPGRVFFGVAGWSYADWRDTVYKLPPAPEPALFELSGNRPSPAAAAYAADPLAFLAEYLDMMEINSSFYRIPARSSVAAWHRRTAARKRFFFTAKLHGSFTHEHCRDEQAAVRFLQAFEPLLEAKRLPGLLAQFRYDFADTRDNRELLDWIAATFGRHVSVIAEVRHRSWEQAPGMGFLLERGFTVAALDYPTAADSFDLREHPGTPGAYLRLHGRNREAWFARGGEPHEPYNYDYTDDEIDELGDRGRHLLEKAKTLTIVANNHYRGKAVSAALRLKAELTEQQVPVPPALLETYPNLKRIARRAAEDE